MNLVHQLMRRGVAVVAGVGLAGSVMAFSGTAYAVDHHAASHASPKAHGSHHGDDTPVVVSGGSSASDTGSSSTSSTSSSSAAAPTSSPSSDAVTQPAQVCAEGVMRIERDGSRLIEHADCSVETVPAPGGVSGSPGRTVTSGPVGPAQPMSGDAVAGGSSGAASSGAVFGERVEPVTAAPTAAAVATAPAAAKSAPVAAKTASKPAAKVAVKSTAVATVRDPQPDPAGGAQVLGESITRVPVIVERAPGDPLPVTGRNIVGLAVTGIATILFGIVLVVIGLRRRSGGAVRRLGVAATR